MLGAGHACSFSKIGNDHWSGEHCGFSDDHWRWGKSTALVRLCLRMLTCTSKGEGECKNGTHGTSVPEECLDWSLTLADALALANKFLSHIIQSHIKLLLLCWVPRWVSLCAIPSKEISQIPTAPLSSGHKPQFFKPDIFGVSSL